MTLQASDLLQPSLSDTSRLKAAPFTLQASILAAFFGGPFAAVGMFAANSIRTDRGPKDAGWIVAMLGVAICWFWWCYGTEAGRSAMVALSGFLGARASSISERAMALLLFAIGAARQRAEQRAADLYGLTRPNGFGLGIAMIVVGSVLSAVLSRLLA